MDTIKIDYHLSHYNTASVQLVEGINNPKEFARVHAIREASLLAIALEANIISMIGDGKLTRDEWDQAIAFIKHYEPPKEMSFAEYRLEQGCEECPCGDMDVYSCAGECGWGDAA